MRPSRVLLLVLALVLGWAWPATAHTALLSVDPADGARLETAPDRIVLTFNEPIRQPSDASVSVDGSTRDVDVSVDGPRLVVTLADPVPGSYELNYRVLSADGHPVSGSSAFTVAGSAEQSPGAQTPVEPSEDPSAVASESDDQGGVPPALWGVLGAVVLLGVAAFAVISLRARSSR